MVLDALVVISVFEIIMCLFYLFDYFSPIRASKTGLRMPFACFIHLFVQKGCKEMVKSINVNFSEINDEALNYLS